MGPVRGYKKRRKTEKKLERHASGYGSGSLEKEGTIDWWEGFSKRINGFRSLSDGLDKFQTIFKMSRRTFDYICSLVEEDMMAKVGNFSFTNGKPMSFRDQVAVALRRLSSGDSLMSVGESFGLSHSTVSQVTWRFVESMEERGLRHLQWPTTKTEMANIKSKFEKIQGLPNCCGVIDTTHIIMCLPTSDPSTNAWLDHEKNYSMILQAVVDPDMRFRDIVTGWPGKMKDIAVFQSSNFCKLCEKGERLNGEKHLYSAIDIREYIIGDSGFPLSPYLMVPYEGKDLHKSQIEFNKRHSETKMVADKALAKLKETWRIIQGVMWRPDKNRLPRIVLACCLLHNILIDMEDEVQKKITWSSEHDSGYHQQSCADMEIHGLSERDKLCYYSSMVLKP